MFAYSKGYQSEQGEEEHKEDWDNEWMLHL